MSDTPSCYFVDGYAFSKSYVCQNVYSLNNYETNILEADILSTDEFWIILPDEIVDHFTWIKWSGEHLNLPPGNRLILSYLKSSQYKEETVLLEPCSVMQVPLDEIWLPLNESYVSIRARVHENKLKCIVENQAFIFKNTLMFKLPISQ